MRQDEIEAQVRPFIGRLETFADGFKLYEGRGATTIISTCADRVDYLGSSTEKADIDGDGEVDERVVHWINIRLGSTTSERPHVRKVVSWTEDPFALTMQCDDGRRVICMNVDEGFDGETLETLRKWRKTRDANRTAYDQIGAAVLDEARRIAADWK